MIKGSAIETQDKTRLSIFKKENCTVVFKRQICYKLCNPVSLVKTEEAYDERGCNNC